MASNERKPMRREMPDDEEIRLFRESVGEVRKIPSDDRIREARRPPPRPEQTENSERSVRDELLTHDLDYDQVETGEELSWIRDGLQRRILTRLRRGQYSVGGELDLHQMNLEAARNSIHEFLDDCQRHGVSCVRIIHGKGLRSKSRGPVLKSLVNGLLRRRSDVLAFTSAPPHDGGTGAVYVLIKIR